MAEGVELATAYVTIIPSLKGATRQIEQQLGGVDTSKAGSAIGKSLGGSIGKSLDLSAIGAGLSDAGQKLADVGGKLTAGITVPLVGATAAAGTFALRTASAAETTEISFTTMLGSEEAALSMMEELADFAAHTPFELSGLQTATRQLLAYGFTAEDVIPMLTAVGDATAALGTGQAGIESVTRALGQMQTRGKVSAEEMLQLTEAGIPAWEYLARAIGTDTAGAMDAVTEGAVSASEGIQAIVSGMENDFGGMMEEQSKTVEGLFSNLSDAIEQPLMKLRESDAYERFADSLSDVVDAAGPFVESLLPHMEDGLDAVSGVLDAATDAMDSFSSMSEEGQSQLIGMATAAAAAGPALTIAGKGMQLLGGATKGAGSLIKAGQKAVGTLGDKLLDFATAPETAGTVLGKFAGVVASIPTPVTVAAGVIGGLAVTALGAMAAEAAEASEHEALLADATTSASDIMSSAIGSADGLGDAIGGIATDAEGTLEALAELNASVAESLGETAVDSGRLDQYVSVIDELANKTGLTATEQYRLSEAVKGFNEVTGESYSVVDAANGKIADQNGVLQENADQLHASADAWKQRAQSEALSNVATQYLEAEAEAAYDLSVAQQNLADAQAEYADVTSRMNSMTDKSSDEFYELGRRAEELSGQIPGLEQEVSDLSAAHETAAQSANDFSNAAAIQSAVFSTLGDDAMKFTTQLGETGVGLETFAGLTDEQLAHLASSWDGTSQSIVATLDAMGIEMGDAGLSAATALANGMASGQVDVDTATSILKAAATGDWSSVSSQMSSAGISLPQSVADGITSNSFAASGATNTMLSMIALQLTGGDVPAAAQLLGHDIDQGLADGIANGTLSDEQAALLGEDVINRAKDTLESHSPSQAFYRIGSDVDAGLSLGISGNTSGPLGAIGQLGQSLIDRISGLPGEAQATGSGASGGLSAGLAAGVGSVAASAMSLASSASSGVAGTPSDLSDKGRSASSNFASGIGSGVGATRTSADRLSSAASNMGGGDSWTWGSHLGQNFASGLSSAWDAVCNAASSLASAAADFLGFTAPDKGPWSGSEKGGVTSGMHLGQNFADGMMRSIPEVERASLALADAAAVDASAAWDAQTMRAKAPYHPGGGSETDALLRQVVGLLSDIYGVIPEGMDQQTFGRAVRKAVGYGI